MGEGKVIQETVQYRTQERSGDSSGDLSGAKGRWFMQERERAEADVQFQTWRLGSCLEWLPAGTALQRGLGAGWAAAACGH